MDTMLETLPGTENEQATRKERFDLLIGLLKDHYAGIIDFEFKNAALLLVALGWILTSEGARGFLNEHIAVGALMCGILLLNTAYHAVWTYNFYRRSRVVFYNLVELSYVPLDHYENRRIPLFTLISFITVHTALTFVICGVIFITSRL